VQLPDLPEPWRELSGLRYSGYEIRHGRTTPSQAVVAQGAVLGLLAHGAFESAAVLKALFGRAPERSLDDVFDDLADAVERHLDTDRLLALAGIG